MTKCYNLDAYRAKKCKQKKVDLMVYRPDYRKYLSPEILYIPYKWFAPQTPLKKILKKFQARAIQGHVPWLNLKKNFQISFSQYANNVWTPLFRSMRQAQNTDTHALNQLGVSQNSSQLWSNFTADKTHLASTLSLDVKVMNKWFIIAVLKMSQNKR